MFTWCSQQDLLQHTLLISLFLGVSLLYLKENNFFAFKRENVCVCLLESCAVALLCQLRASTPPPPPPGHPCQTRRVQGLQECPGASWSSGSICMLCPFNTYWYKLARYQCFNQSQQGLGGLYKTKSAFPVACQGPGCRVLDFSS